MMSSKANLKKVITIEKEVSQVAMTMFGEVPSLAVLSRDMSMHILQVKGDEVHTVFQTL